MPIRGREASRGFVSGSIFKKIERWHQTLKNRILLDNYHLPRDLERQIGAFVEYHNHVRHHESIETS